MVSTEVSKYRVGVVSNITGSFRYWLRDVNDQVLVSELIEKHQKRDSIFLYLKFENAAPPTASGIEIFDSSLVLSLSKIDDPLVHERFCRQMHSVGIAEIAKSFAGISYNSNIQFNGQTDNLLRPERSEVLYLRVLTKDR